MTEVTAMQFESNDTDDRLGRIVGVEDESGDAWCCECADAEIRRAGETAFSVDVYAGWGGARRKCSRCGRRLGEVA